MINLEKFRLLNERVGNAVSLINKLRAENQTLKTRVSALESELKDSRKQKENQKSDEALAEKSLQGVLDTLGSLSAAPGTPASSASTPSKPTPSKPTPSKPTPGKPASSTPASAAPSPGAPGTKEAPAKKTVPEKEAPEDIDLDEDNEAGDHPSEFDIF